MQTIFPVRWSLVSAAAAGALAILFGGAFVARAGPGAHAHAAYLATAPQAAADDSSLNDLLAKAQSDIDNQDYAAAAEKYRAYLEKQPQNAQIHFQLGYCYTALQKIDDARTEYQKATEIDPTMAPAFLNLGLAELSRDSAAAVAPLQRAVQLMPNQERPLLLLATALAHSGKTDDAIAQFAAAEKIDPNDFQLHIGYGEALLNANRDQDAEREFRAANALNPNEPSGHLGLAECLLAEKSYGPAADEFAVYLQAKPDDNQAREMRAQALIQAGKYDGATAELKRAGASASTQFDALMLQYGSLMDQKRYDEALAVLVQAEALAPGNASVHATLGQMFIARKTYPDAAREYIAALKISPGDPACAQGLAQAEYLAKDYADALKAVDLLPQNQPIPAPTLFIRADSYDKLGKKPEALEAYDKFLSVNTDKNSDMYFASAERARELRRELGKKQ